MLAHTLQNDISRHPLRPQTLHGLTSSKNVQCVWSALEFTCLGTADRSFYPREIAKKRGFAGKAFVRWVGLNPAEFEEVFTASVTDVGVKLRDLPWNYYSSNKYKGVLVRDNGQLNGVGITYELSYELSLQDSEVFLNQENHFRVQQPEKVVSYLLSPSQMEDEFWKSLRNAVLNVRSRCFAQRFLFAVRACVHCVVLLVRKCLWCGCVLVVVLVASLPRVGGSQA